MPTVLTRRRSAGDMFKYILSPAVCLVSGIFRNTSGGTLTNAYPMGQPVKVSSGKYVPVVAGDEANAVGLVWTDEKIASLANNTDYSPNLAFLRKGPAVVLIDALPTLDLAGGTLNWTTLATALLAQDITLKSDPVTTSIQTT